MDHLQKRKKDYKNKKKTGDSRDIYFACFQYDMACGNYKDLTARTTSDKILHNKAFNITKNTKYDGYQRGLVSMVYRVFDKKTAGGVAKLSNKSAVKNENILNKKLAEELHKPIIREFKNLKVYQLFKENIWGVDLTDMQLMSKFNKGFRFLLCAIDVFSTYVWVIPLKD